MNKILLLFVIIQSFSFISNEDINLEIRRARSHYDQTGNLVPLVVSLSNPDKTEKLKGVDLIIIWDISTRTIYEDYILIEYSIKYLYDQVMSVYDNFALVAFSNTTKKNN